MARRHSPGPSILTQTGFGPVAAVLTELVATFLAALVDARQGHPRLVVTQDVDARDRRGHDSEW